MPTRRRTGVRCPTAAPACSPTSSAWTGSWPRIRSPPTRAVAGGAGCSAGAAGLRTQAGTMRRLGPAARTQVRSGAAAGMAAAIGMAAAGTTMRASATGASTPGRRNVRPAMGIQGAAPPGQPGTPVPGTRAGPVTPSRARPRGAAGARTVRRRVRSPAPELAGRSQAIQAWPPAPGVPRPSQPTRAWPLVPGVPGRSQATQAWPPDRVDRSRRGPSRAEPVPRAGRGWPSRPAQLPRRGVMVPGQLPGGGVVPGPRWPRLTPARSPGRAAIWDGPRR